MQSKIIELTSEIERLDQNKQESELAAKIEEKYLKDVNQLQEELGKIKAENSEMKAKQLMSAF